MSGNKLLVGIVILTVVAVGALVAINSVRNASIAGKPSDTTPTVPTASPSAATSQNTVTITTSGFSPKEVIIKVGDSVTWVNNDSGVHNVSSAMHPTHLVYPPLNLGNMVSGEKKSLTFPTTGNYEYHDHLTPSLNGTVVVQ